MHATPSQLRSLDPYHRWLGIPPEEQPAHHYRLLGLAPFESDPDVISSAADQRIAHIQGMIQGPEAEVARRIVGQLKLARGCLLDAHRKCEYDAQLRAAHAPAATGHAGPAAASNTPRPMPTGSPRTPIPTARFAGLPTTAGPAVGTSVPAVPVGSAVPGWNQSPEMGRASRGRSRRRLPEVEVSAAAAYRRRRRSKGQEGIIAIAVLVFLGLATMVWVMTQGNL